MFEQTGSRLVIRKTLERSERGVVLIRVEDLSVRERPVALGYRLSTPWSSFVVVDRDEAHAAFWTEVKSLSERPAAARACAGR